VAGRKDDVFSPAHVTEVVVLLPPAKMFYSSSGGHADATSPSMGS
jgi:hypothetical protein